MVNRSGLKPLGVAVLVETYEPERKAGVIAIPDAVRGRMSMVDNRATVIEVGPSAWHDEPTPRAKAGDKVLVTQFAGFMAKGPRDGKQYRLVNDRDIFCAITSEGDGND
jgi:co-chaperonin GroES (HSP10)